MARIIASSCAAQSLTIAIHSSASLDIQLPESSWARAGKQTVSFCIACSSTGEMHGLLLFCRASRGVCASQLLQS